MRGWLLVGLLVVLLVGVPVAVWEAVKHPAPSVSECREKFAERVGHSEADAKFWDALVACAEAGKLPPGQNNPDFYR